MEELMQTVKVYLPSGHGETIHGVSDMQVEDEILYLTGPSFTDDAGKNKRRLRGIFHTWAAVVVQQDEPAE